MGMEDIVIIGRDGMDINRLRDLFNHAERTAAPLRFTVDDGYLKVKVGQGTWSPPMGSRDPACEAALAERGPREALDVMARTRLANGGRGAVDVEPGRFGQAAQGATTHGHGWATSWPEPLDVDARDLPPGY